MNDDSANTSRILSTWTDEQYAMVSAKMVDKAIAGKAMTLGYQLDLGKWMLASLLVVNGGALVAIANADDVAPRLFMAGGTWFVAGMVAALVSGFFAWTNAAVAADVYDDIANPWALVSRDNWPSVSARASKAITATTLLSIAAGVTSVVFFTVGAQASGLALSPRNKTAAPISAAGAAKQPQISGDQQKITNSDATAARPINGSSSLGSPGNDNLGPSACPPAAPDRTSDLCAQWQSADAALSSVGWARRGFWVSIAGLAAAFCTLAAAVAAAYFAWRAAEETKRGADASQGSADAFVKVEDASLILTFPGGHVVTGPENYYSLHAHVSNVGRSAALIHSIKFGDEDPVLMNVVVKPNDERAFPDWVHVSKIEGKASSLTTLIEYTTAFRDRATLNVTAAVLLDPKDHTPWAFTTRTSISANQGK